MWTALCTHTGFALHSQKSSMQFKNILHIYIVLIAFDVQIGTKLPFINKLFTASIKEQKY